MGRHVDLVWTDVSEERIASIFRVEESASEEPAWAGGSCVPILLTSSRWSPPSVAAAVPGLSARAQYNAEF
jgi:hypothetical protein